MAPPKRNAPTKAQERTEMLDKLLAEIDPEVMLVGVLGAIATAGGLTPPLTRILMSVGGNVDLGSDIANKMASAWYGVAQFGSPLLFALGLTFEDDSAVDPTKKAGMQAIVACGAMEAMMIMSLMKNPAAISALASLVPTKVL